MKFFLLLSFVFLCSLSLSGKQITVFGSSEALKLNVYSLQVNQFEVNSKKEFSDTDRCPTPLTGQLGLERRLCGNCYSTKGINYA